VPLLQPAFLVAAQLPLPRQVLIHGHFTVDKVKMSKSLGNVVDPLPLARRYGACALRFFLLAEGRAEFDADFSMGILSSDESIIIAPILAHY
jgi:methionyl-tRNA synthetase